MRCSWRGTGDRLATHTSGGVPSAPWRAKATTLRSASSASIQENPAGSKSTSHRAGCAPVGVVEVADQRLHAAVGRVLQQVPVEAARLAPLPLLGDLAPHEEELLARVGPHVAVEGPQVGEALPAVAGHLLQQRPLAVHHLVVAEGQHEALGEGVDEREGELAVVVLAVRRLPAEVAEGVVHPAHVPLEPEPQAALVGGARHAGPGGGLLGHRHGAGLLGVDDPVELLEERHRLEVLAPAVLVGHPLPGLAGVVEVEHGGHRIDAEAVGVHVLEPEQGVGQQEAEDLVAPVVEHERAPVGVRAPSGVGVLVEGGAVEAGQGPLVAGEVGRHPVEQHADAVGVEAVDEGLERLGRPPHRGRGVERRDLVAPRPAEGVLHHRQQLDVGEAHVGDVGGQLVGQLGVGRAARRGATGRAATSPRAPRRCSWARSTGGRPVGARPSPRRTTRSPAGGRSRRWPAGPRPGGPGGRRAG